MNEKDALTANGMDDKWKMEEIYELQHKKKEKKDHSPNPKNDYENTPTHTRSSNIPEEGLLPQITQRQTVTSSMEYRALQEVLLLVRWRFHFSFIKLFSKQEWIRGYFSPHE